VTHPAAAVPGMLRGPTQAQSPRHRPRENVLRLATDPVSAAVKRARVGREEAHFDDGRNGASATDVTYPAFGGCQDGLFDPPNTHRGQDDSQRKSAVKR
jgi:hypothetical protein